jgi:hypothetical protein
LPNWPRKWWELGTGPLELHLDSHYARSGTELDGSSNAAADGLAG